MARPTHKKEECLECGDTTDEECPICGEPVCEDCIDDHQEIVHDDEGN